MDGRGNVSGSLNIIAPAHLQMEEMHSLTRSKKGRLQFRRLVAVQLAQIEWSQLDLTVQNNAFQIVPLAHPWVNETYLIQAYQAIWLNADVYQKVFTKAEVRELLPLLKSGFVMLDQRKKVCGLVAGWPILQTPNADFAQQVDSPSKATYLAEWGLADSSKHSPYRGLGFGGFLLTLYLQRLLAEGQKEVVLGTAEKGYGEATVNHARSLYEAHGFLPCRDKNGRFITKPITQRRLDGKLGTHTTMFYRATADSIGTALQPKSASIDDFQFETRGIFP